MCVSVTNKFLEPLVHKHTYTVTGSEDRGPLFTVCSQPVRKLV